MFIYLILKGFSSLVQWHKKGKRVNFTEPVILYLFHLKFKTPRTDVIQLYFYPMNLLQIVICKKKSLIKLTVVSAKRQNIKKNKVEVRS